MAMLLLSASLMLLFATVDAIAHGVAEGGPIHPLRPIAGCEFGLAALAESGPSDSTFALGTF